MKLTKTQLFKMIQSRGVICDIPTFSSISSYLAKKITDIARDLEKDFRDKQTDKFNEEYITGKGY